CADAQHLGDPNPRLPSIERLHEDLVDLHGPLHCSLGVGHPHLLGGDDSPAACSERSDHLLSGADRSCTPDTACRKLLDRISLSADPRAHRVAGMASDMIGDTVSPGVEPNASATISTGGVDERPCIDGGAIRTLAPRGWAGSRLAKCRNR